MNLLSKWSQHPYATSRKSIWGCKKREPWMRTWPLTTDWRTGDPMMGHKRTAGAVYFLLTQPFSRCIMQQKSGWIMVPVRGFPCVAPMEHLVPRDEGSRQRRDGSWFGLQFCAGSIRNFTHYAGKTQSPDRSKAAGAENYKEKSRKRVRESRAPPKVKNYVGRTQELQASRSRYPGPS